MKNLTDEVLQWSAAFGIIAGHGLNALGPDTYPYNIVAFTLGTVLFLTWALRNSNRPQVMVNVVRLAISLVGLYKAAF